MISTYEESGKSGFEDSDWVDIGFDRPDQFETLDPSFDEQEFDQQYEEDERICEEMEDHEELWNNRGRFTEIYYSNDHSSEFYAIVETIKRITTFEKEWNELLRSIEVSTTLSEDEKFALKFGMVDYIIR